MVERPLPWAPDFLLCAPSSLRFGAERSARPTVTCAADSLSQLHFHSVIRDTHINTSLIGHRVDPGRDLTLVAGHNFRSAMRDHCPRYTCFLAPCQLRPNRRVTG